MTVNQATRRLSVLASLYFGLCFLSLAASASMPSLTTQATSTKDVIRAHMSKVDDRGLVIVWNEKEVKQVLSCRWKPLHHGAAEGDITKYLTAGENYVIFILYNTTYHGPSILTGGKWSYKFMLTKNGDVAWSMADYREDNTRGVKYWKAIKASATSTGRITLDKNFTPPPRFEVFVERIEDELNQSSGGVTPYDDMGGAAI